jgi:hypothetical protein
MEIAAPVIMSVVPDCRLYRSVADAAAAAFPVVQGYSTQAASDWRSLTARCRCQRPNPTAPTSSPRCWLGYIDALRESTMNWSLGDLVQASADFSMFD